MWRNILRRHIGWLIAGCIIGMAHAQEPNEGIRLPEGGYLYTEHDDAFDDVVGKALTVGGWFSVPETPPTDHFWLLLGKPGCYAVYLDGPYTDFTAGTLIQWNVGGRTDGVGFTPPPEWTHIAFQIETAAFQGFRNSLADDLTHLNNGQTTPRSSYGFYIGGSPNISLNDRFPWPYSLPWVLNFTDEPERIKFATFGGRLGEIRISDTLLYDQRFRAVIDPQRPFQADEHTVALWR
ncbi:MAG: hypothetical protein O3A46_15670, partial [Candidatus Poribacteria bacterium]|nr:hypothetical protein [Candidatus Poribacteria bacterium]